MLPQHAFRQKAPVTTRAKEPRKKGPTKSTYKPVVPAVEQASRILFCLAESPHPKQPLTDICKQLNIHKSKGYSILNTLNQFGLVEKDPLTKTYSLGPSLIFLSRNVLDHLSYPDVAAPFLQNLARETNGTAVFGLIHDDHVFVVGKNEGNQNIGFSLRLGHRFHITLGAHGKAISAFLGEAERERLLAKKKLYFYGHPSRMDMKRLSQDLAKCREAGFAHDIGEVTPGVNVISAPVFAHRGKIVGCLIVIGTFPKDAIDQQGLRVAEMARQISYRLGASVPTDDRAGAGSPRAPRRGFLPRQAAILEKEAT